MSGRRAALRRAHRRNAAGAILVAFCLMIFAVCLLYVVARGAHP